MDAIPARRTISAAPVATSTIPDCWILDPLRAEMRIRVRPPTQRTRRRLVEVKDAPLPHGCFEAFMAPLQEGEAPGVERDETTGMLKPTKQAAALEPFEYTVVRPMVTDRLFQLELSDFKKGPEKATRAKGAWRRGSGCACLVLPRGAHRTGRLARRMSMVAGHLRIIYKQPRRQVAMPRLTLRFFVLTIDRTGHIEWPANFSTKGQAILRKLARKKLEAMLVDPAYPVDPSMSVALKKGSSGVLALRSSANGYSGAVAPSLPPSPPAPSTPADPEVIATPLLPADLAA
eukprot:3935987-Pleurochrysis_carterae.AAC.2